MASDNIFSGLSDLWRRAHMIPPQPHAKDPCPWHLANRNKRGITLDLKSPDAREVLERLVRWADALIVNTPHPARKRLKLEYDDDVPWNRRLIYADVTGFGEKGPDADLPGFDAYLSRRTWRIKIPTYPRLICVSIPIQRRQEQSNPPRGSDLPRCRDGRISGEPSSLVAALQKDSQSGHERHQSCERPSGAISTARCIAGFGPGAGRDGAGSADGMGMSLAISYTIIEAHSGQLRAMTNVPKGAKFEFKLPINGH